MTIQLQSGTGSNDNEGVHKLLVYEMISIFETPSMFTR